MPIPSSAHAATCSEVSTPSTAACADPPPAPGIRQCAAPTSRRDVVEQVAGERLRAQARHADALLAVGDGQPFGERDRGVLGDRIRRRAQLGEQAGRRGGDDQVALTPRQHARQHRARHVDVTVHVDRPDPRPGVVGGFLAARHDDPGVREEQPDRPERVPRRWRPAPGRRLPSSCRRAPPARGHRCPSISAATFPAPSASMSQTTTPAAPRAASPRRAPGRLRWRRR